MCVLFIFSGANMAHRGKAEIVGKFFGVAPTCYFMHISLCSFKPVILQCKNTVGGLNRRFYWVWHNGTAIQPGAAADSLRRLWKRRRMRVGAGSEILRLFSNGVNLFMLNLKLRFENVKSNLKNKTWSIFCHKKNGQTEYRGVGLGPKISSKRHFIAFLS